MDTLLNPRSLDSVSAANVAETYIKGEENGLTDSGLAQGRWVLESPAFFAMPMDVLNIDVGFLYELALGIEGWEPLETKDIRVNLFWQLDVFQVATGMSVGRLEFGRGARLQNMNIALVVPGSGFPYIRGFDPDGKSLSLTLREGVDLVAGLAYEIRVTSEVDIVGEAQNFPTVAHQMIPKKEPILWASIGNDDTTEIPQEILNEVSDLDQGTTAFNLIDLDLNNQEVFIALDLRELPKPETSTLLNEEGFTEVNLVHLDRLDGSSGIVLGRLDLDTINDFTFDLSLFDSVGGFDPWLLSYTIENSGTGQQIRFYDDKSVPEPSTSFSLIAIGIGGTTLTLKRKQKPSKSTEKVS